MRMKAGRTRMQFIDTYDKIDTCFPNGKFDRKSWEKYANNISETLVAKAEQDIGKYDFEKEVLPVLNFFIQNKDSFAMAHDSFLAVTQGLADKVSKQLGTLLDVCVIFYLGLCNAAGWATELDGRAAVLLGVEKIVELSWCDRQSMIGLIYHELGHIWHFQVRKETFEGETQKEKALWQLYTEGIAMYVEQLLCEDENFYHQDVDGWLNWCTEHRAELFRAYAEKVENGESVQEFFGDWCNYNGKSDVGYYLGCELIKYLLQNYSLMESANMAVNEIEERMKELVAGL